jgi:6-phosphogluconolactonase (cycloisomerase 2 family)
MEIRGNIISLKKFVLRRMGMESSRTLRRGVFGLAILALLAISAYGQGNGKVPRFAFGAGPSGGGKSGIYTYTMDPVTAETRLVTYTDVSTLAGSSFVVAGNNVAVDPSGKFLYSLIVNPQANAAEIVGFAINQSDGSLVLVPGAPLSCSCFPNFNAAPIITFNPAGGFLYTPAGTGSTADAIAAFAIDSTTGSLTAVSGSPFAAGNGTALAMAVPSGNFLYAPNTTDGTISAFSVNLSTGALTPLAGSPFAFAPGSPSFLAIDPASQFLYVAQNITNSANGSLVGYSINSTTGALTPLANPVAVSSDLFGGIIIDPGGKFLYVSGESSPPVCDGGTCGYSINSSTGALTPLPGNSINNNPPGGVIEGFDPSGKFFVEQIPGNYYQPLGFNSSTGALTPLRIQFLEVGAPSGFLGGSTPLIHVPSFAYVADSAGNSISAYAVDFTSGSLTPISGSPFAAGTGPSAIAADRSGRFLFVANSSSNNVSAYSIDSTTGSLTSVTGSPFAAGTAPAGVATDPSGEFLFVTNKGSNNVSEYAIDRGSGALSEITGSPFAAGTGPTGVFSYAIQQPGAGAFFSFVQTQNFTSNNQTFFTLSDSAPGAFLGSSFTAGTGPTGEIAGAADTTVAPNGAGYITIVANASSNNATEQTSGLNGFSGTETTFSAGVNPQSVAFDPNDHFLYIAGGPSGSTGAVSAFSIDSGVPVSVAGSPFATGKSPVSIAVDPSAQFVYVVNSGDNTVSAYAIDSANGSLAPLSGSPFVTGSNPRAIVIIGGLQTPPAVSLSPTSLSFSTQNVGTTSSTQTISLTNNGGSALAISGIAIGGTNVGDFQQTNNCGTSVAANASCSINVTFTPAAVGTRTATVSVTDNANGSPQTVPLTGAGGGAVAIPTPAALTFGSQTLGTSSAPQSVTLTNSGNSTLTISSITFAGTDFFDFTETNTCGTGLLAGANCTISVTFAPESGTSTGTVTASLSIADNVSGSPQTVTLTGTATSAGAPAVVIAPTTLTFPSQTVGTSSVAQTVTLTNSGNATLNITSVAITGANAGDYSETNTCGTILAASANCAISVTFKPTATGTRTASISIADNASGSPQTVALSGTGAAATAPVVTRSPTTLTFASQTVGTNSVAQTVTLTNSGNATLNITGVTITGANAGDYSETNTCGATLAASANCSISVTFKPTASGARTASVSIADNASGSPQTVPLSGTAVAAPAPAVTFAPTSLTFASQLVASSSAAQSITLTNSGNATLSVSGVAITGTNAGDYSETNTCGATLAASANCAISVTFKPTASGTRTASVSITDNASGSPQTVALSGTAVAPDFSLTASPAALSVTAGQSGTATIAVTPSNGFNQAVSFSCSGLPTGASCSFSPSTVTPTGSAASTTLAISTSASSAFLPQEIRFRPARFPTSALFALLLVFLALFGATSAPYPRLQRRWVSATAGVLLLASIGLMTGCGSGSKVKAPINATVTITGTSGSGAGATTHSATITLTVTS